MKLHSNGLSHSEIARKTGVARSTVGDIIRRCEGTLKPRSTVSPRKVAKPGKARTFDEFREKHDIAHIIQSKVDEYLQGDVYYDDNDFRELCGIPSNQWRRYADSGEFDEHRVQKSNRINAWAPKSMAKKMREVLDIHG